ncbi:unnamed protein product, partial [Mesorhabditis belari]|uniref:Aspartyl aminopeptidase n=1 Tax=Mesorhabditis belari TaxID=2138241 RepID=A0AAF3EWA4_9BILA
MSASVTEYLNMMRSIGSGKLQNHQLKPHSDETLALAREFVHYLDKAVTPFHAVAECADRLRASGFKELDMGSRWDIAAGGKYFVTKNNTTIFAIVVGGQYQPGNGFSIVAAHSDSPCLRVKPKSKLESEGCLQVGCSTYGGGLWRTWFDRDLSLAGMIVVKTDTGLLHKLVDLRGPIMTIPSLAIHLQEDRSSKFDWNNETHLRPILLTNAFPGVGEKTSDQHHPQLLTLIAKSAEVDPLNIVSMDLYLYDAQKPAITGLFNEFISGGRLDNQVGMYTSVSALIASLSDGAVESDPNIRIAACFDNEEVGSQSAQGADSMYIQWVLRKLSNSPSNPVAFEEAMAKSVLISADQAHAVHPNYKEKCDENHRVSIHGGPVIKLNVNQRYATTATTSAIVKEIADEAGIPIQEFVVKNDSPCGSTIGPMLSANLGLATVDMGCPQLAMHSIREMAGTSSILQAVALYTKFYSRLPSLLAHTK